MKTAVRLAALKRLNDYETWRERATADTDDQLRAAARAAYLALLCSDDARAPSLARRIAELDTLGAAEIEDVASRAYASELRAAALERVTRPALLAERSLADPDARLRVVTLERIRDVAVLERIAERARKTDKIVNRRARELAESLRIGSGDAQAIADKAQMLCTRAETLLRSSQARATDLREAIERDWERLGDAVPSDLQQRFRGTISLLQQLHAEPLERKSVVTAEEVDTQVAAETIEPVATAMPSIDLLAAQAKVQASLAVAAEASKREREQHRARVHDTERLIEQYADRLEAGDISAAHMLHASIVHARDALGDAPAVLDARLAPLHARYAELARWQRWSNDQRRQALCAEIETAASTGLHPDALAARVREAREEWQRLDTAQGPGHVDSGLARRFHALCHRALKPARQYFDKRDAVRRNHASEIETLLQTQAALPAEIVDWKAASTLRKQLGDALHGLDAVDPRERTVLARRLKEAISVIAARIDVHIAGIESARGRLIERAAAIAERAEARDTTREVRELQREWTALGQGRHAVDQRQWNEFRRHCDAVFGKLDAARTERAAADAAARTQAESLLAQIDNLHSDASAKLDTSQAELRALAGQWQSLPNTDRSLDQRYRKAHQAASDRLRAAVRTQRLARFVTALDRYALLREVECGTATPAELAARWETSSPTQDVLVSALNARLAHAQSAAPIPVDDAAARPLLVALEFLAGVDTPQEDRELRMAHQLQRLASRMRERSDATPEAEFTRVLLAWFAQMPQSDALEQRFACAARAAINSLP